ncbi:MAG: hypothetical protein IIT37_12905, partial [Bacteroidales bacterium]|nr:hypothetical protein [Bacteroidales bacterium]
DIDGNKYYDFLQAGGPTVLGSNPPEVREQVIDLLNTCGPSTGLFHDFEYKLAKKVSDSVETEESNSIKREYHFKITDDVLRDIENTMKAKGYSPQLLKDQEYEQYFL